MMDRVLQARIPSAMARWVQGTGSYVLESVHLDDALARRFDVANRHSGKGGKRKTEKDCGIWRWYPCAKRIGTLGECAAKAAGFGCRPGFVSVWSLEILPHPVIIAD